MHNMIMENREHLTLTGIIDVESFDERIIVTITEMETLIIKGTDLSVLRLDSESKELEITGNIYSLLYETSTPRDKRGIFGKVLK